MDTVWSGRAPFGRLDPWKILSHIFLQNEVCSIRKNINNDEIDNVNDYGYDTDYNNDNKIFF